MMEDWGWTLVLASNVVWVAAYISMRQHYRRLLGHAIWTLERVQAWQKTEAASDDYLRVLLARLEIHLKPE